MDGDIVLFYNPHDPPFAALVAHQLCQTKTQRKFKIAMKGDPFPSLQFMKTKEKLVGNHVAARFLARVADASVENPAQKLYGSDPFTATQIDFFVDLASNDLHPLQQQAQKERAIADIDSHLANRSFLVTAVASLADIAVWGAIKADPATLKLVQANKGALARWFASCEDAFVKLLPQRAAEAKKPAEPAEKKANGAPAAPKQQQGGSFDIDLPDAAEGKVCTRFPPEPSGYLHIGHAKAALLNHTIAQMYKGRMILRFDDTNPSKEKDEYVDNIMKDLQVLGVKYDVITHTSDSFDLILKYGEQLLRDGKGYIDDTPVEQMRKERMDGIESKNRNRPIEENLKLWKEMIAATELGQKHCMRGKVDMKALNKAMRDPVFFRCNLTPHHRTGTKYKCYPTYDFACPIVDSVEGVTHALRTTEYHDRNAQYEWVLKALNLRWVHIWDFSRLNFKYTVMSKRKLQWFVDNNRVDGWYDPRFPTVQGITRRGLTIDALREFIRLQGASKSIALMEWDKIWAINKRMIDPIAHRYTAVAKDGAVVVKLSNHKKAEEKDVPLLPKDPSAGSKKLAFTPEILIEQADAAEIKDGEEVTLIQWGNAIMKKVNRGADGKVASIDAELHLEGNVKTTDKKLTWIPKSDKLVTINMVEFDSLIVKEKLEEDDEWTEFIRPKSKVETTLLGEPAIAAVKAAQILQLQRRGYFRVDELASKDKPVQFFLIPDGKEKTMSVLQSNVGKEMRAGDAKTKKKDAKTAQKKAAVDKDDDDDRDD